MKKQLLNSALIAIAGVGLLAGNVLATPTEVDYYTITDSNTYTTPSISFLNLLNAEGFFIAPGNSFGIYAKDDPTNAIAILYSADPVQLFFEEIGGTMYVDYDSNVQDGGVVFDDVFGFYFTDVTGTYYTDASLNSDGLEHISMDYVPVIATASFNWSFNFLGTTVTNPISLSIETHDVAPIPEPTTMVLFGTGLMGLASLARRKKI